MRANKEYHVCKAVAQYMRLKYPYVLFHFDLAGLNLSRAQAGMMKAIQGSRGWPDLMILHPENGRVLFLEIKAEGTRLINRQCKLATPHLREQSETLQAISKCKHEALFAVGVDECIEFINAFLWQ